MTAKVSYPEQHFTCLNLNSITHMTLPDSRLSLFNLRRPKLPQAIAVFITILIVFGRHGAAVISTVTSQLAGSCIGILLHSCSLCICMGFRRVLLLPPKSLDMQMGEVNWGLDLSRVYPASRPVSHRIGFSPSKTRKV